MTSMVMVFATCRRRLVASMLQRVIMTHRPIPLDICDYPDTGYDCEECLNDSDNDGVCNEFEVAGCTDVSACNYAAAATDDDGSCTYASAGYTCDGSCLLDNDGDGVCDQNEVTGCQDGTACNYDAAATDAGYCDYPETNYNCAGAA